MSAWTRKQLLQGIFGDCGSRWACRKRTWRSTQESTAPMSAALSAGLRTRLSPSWKGWRQPWARPSPTSSWCRRRASRRPRRCAADGGRRVSVAPVIGAQISSDLRGGGFILRPPSAALRFPRIRAAGRCRTGRGGTGVSAGRHSGGAGDVPMDRDTGLADVASRLVPSGRHLPATYFR